MNVEQQFAAWCDFYKKRPAVGGVLLWPGLRKPDGSYLNVYRKLQIRTPLPMPRVVLQGPKWRQCLVTFERRGRVRRHPTLYDFFEDVRELACERVRFDVYAEWADPRDRL